MKLAPAFAVSEATSAACATFEELASDASAPTLVASAAPTTKSHPPLPLHPPLSRYSQFRYSQHPPPTHCHSRKWYPTALPKIRRANHRAGSGPW